MNTYKIVQSVEEIYYIEAESEEDATDILYSGKVQPTDYSIFDIESIEICQELDQNRITCDEFDAVYLPVINHFETDAEWGGYVFVKNDPEQYAYVMQIWEENPSRVWSYCPNCEPTFVRSGWGICDVDGYVITEVPCPENTFITVYDPDLEDLDD